MEYSFRFSAGDELKTIRLDDYTITIRTNGRDEVISYARILSVRISRTPGNIFRLFLYPDDHTPVIIPSRSFTVEGKSEDQSRPYSLMVRVLHHHLREKSEAVFTSGVQASRIWQMIVVSAIFFFVASIGADYLGFSLVNPFVQATALTALAGSLIFVLLARKLPKEYNPAEIPLQFLP